MDGIKMGLFILALLSMPIVAFLLGQIWLGIVFSVFYCIFGVIEVLAKKKSGKTVSQHVWTLPVWKKIVLTIAMVAGWLALILHFWKIM